MRPVAQNSRPWRVALFICSNPLLFLVFPYLCSYLNVPAV